MEEIQVESWGELQETLYAGAYNRELARTRSPYAFRGCNRASHVPDTPLARLGGRFSDVEGHLLRNFRKYAPGTAVRHDSVWNWMTVGRHHGLPTRLMDWTFSPQVALHFATSHLDAFDDDGAVWAVDFSRAHERLPQPLRDELADEGSEVFTVEMLHRRAETLSAFEALSDEPFMLFLEPPSIDARIVNQFALFSVMSSSSARPAEWMEANSGLVRRIVIPAKLKWEVRDRLDQANVTERVLFPGLDGLSAWLKRYYGPRCH